MGENTKSIAVRQATQWFVRLHAHDCSSAERGEFDRWVAGSPENKEAYAAVARTAELCNDRRLVEDPRLKLLAAAALGQPPPEQPIDEREQSPPRQQRVAAVGGRPKNRFSRRLHQYAAVLVLGLTLTLWFAARDRQEAQLTTAQHYVNKEDRRQQFELSDGSLMFLDVGAQVAVSITERERRLEMIKGRAFFDVAHDSIRPFTVRAFDTQTVALGTRFEVNIEPDGVIDVTLAEGSVVVSYQQEQNHTSAWRDVLRPGEQLSVDSHGRRESRKVNADAETSWSSGVLVFDDTPLRQVLDEVNRYAEVKVLLRDESLGEISIGGSFAAGSDSSEFVRTLATALPLNSIRTGPYEIVLFQRPKDHGSE